MVFNGFKTVFCSDLEKGRIFPLRELNRRRRNGHVDQIQSDFANEANETNRPVPPRLSRCRPRGVSARLVADIFCSTEVLLGVLIVVSV